MRERTLANHGYIGTTDACTGKFTFHRRCHSDQSLAICRQNVVSVLDLEGLIAGLDLKGAELRVQECEGANIIHIGTHSHTLKGSTFIEHALRQYRCIDIEALQRFTVCKCICAILDFRCSDRHFVQTLTTRKGILTD